VTLIAIIPLFLCLNPVSSMGQTAGLCTVTVTDADGAPLPGAGVFVKGTSKGAATNASGVCTISSLERGTVLQVKCLGFEDKEIVYDGRASISVVMDDSSIMMDELVVVGYGVQRKKDLSGSIAQVKGDIINEFSNLSVANALQGRVSGVQVTQLNGMPGAGVQVRIRGTNSIKGSNEPLWIIDGFPGDINMINTSDIESVEVLKDASATAIYGSRGANGVVIVTTRRAREGDVRVEYNGSVGVQSLAHQIEMLSGPEYMAYLNEKAAIQGNDPVFTEEQIAANEWDTNWQDEIFRPALITDHAVNVSGGSRKLQGAFGASWFDQQGIMLNTGYNRASIRTNIQYNISDFISVNGGIIYSHADQDRMTSQSGGRTSVITSALVASPLATPHYDDGTWNDFRTQPTSGLNPVAYLNEVKNKFYSDRIVANGGVTIRPLNGLTIQLSGNMLNSKSRTEYFKSKEYPGSKGSASISFGETLHITSNNIITYEKTIDKHFFSVMGGVTYEENTYKGTSTGTAEGFLSDVVDVFDLDAADIKGLPSSSYTNWKLLSFLGRVNYNFDNRYLVTLNMRSDGSSRYSKGNKWGYFPSAAFAWRISQEDFMKNVLWVSDLKLRIGYGYTGSTAIAPYSTQNTLESVNVVFDKNTVVGYAPLDTYQGDLKWETTGQFDLGVDASFLGDRIKLTADYYSKVTKDLLNDVEMPRSSGYTTALRNIGSVRNRGIELALDTRILQKKDFAWDFGLNFSHNKSKVLSLADGNDIFGNTISNDLISGQLGIMREGEEMFLYYGYVDDGYDETGQIVYKDLDGDGSITTLDRTIIGNPNADFLLNFNTTISYKRFSLSTFFQCSYGNDIYSMTLCALGYDYGTNQNTLRAAWTDHWTETNTLAAYPNLLSNLNLKMSDRFVYDGSYLRLKNIELGYDIPVKKKILQKAKVYVSAQNLFTLTSYPGWNPDVNIYGGESSLTQGVDSSGYPVARSFTMGCRLVF